jgi:hypothetical protein
MGVYSNPAAKISVHPKNANTPFNLMGRRIRSPTGVGCIVEKETKRIMMPKTGNTVH